MDASRLELLQVGKLADASSGQHLHRRIPLGHLFAQVLRADAPTPAHTREVEDDYPSDTGGDGSGCDRPPIGCVPRRRPAQRPAIFQVERECYALAGPRLANRLQCFGAGDGLQPDNDPVDPGLRQLGCPP